MLPSEAAGRDGAPPDERGSVAVEALCYVMALCLLLCAVLEFGSWAVAYSAVDDASYASCRALAQNTALSEADLEEIALASSPSLARGELSIARSVGAIEATPYVHHFPNGSGSRQSNVASRKVAARASYSFEPLTVLGRMVAGGDTMTITAETSEESDATVEGGVSEW